MRIPILLTIALVAVFFMASPAWASHMERFEECHPRAAGIAFFLSQNPATRLIGYHHGADAQFILDRYNELPPETSWEADEVLAYGVVGFSTYLVMLHHENCVVLWDEVPRWTMQFWLKLLSDFRREA